jgi:hypothetical protein
MVFMKIDSYRIDLSSSRVYEEKNQETEELKEWGRRDQAKPAVIGNSDSVDRNGQRDRVSLSDEARSGRRSHHKHSENAHSGDDVEQAASGDDEQGLDSRLLTLKRMIEAFTGKKIRLTRIESAPPAETDQKANETDTAGEAPQEQEWGMSYTYSQSHYESEQTSFAAQGLVKTSDGKEIAFTVNLEMSREYFTEQKLEIRAGAPLKDPLVINYAGTAAQLSDMSFEFDLNMDGDAENMKQLAPGSGFLVFDKNKDGKVNDGSELFGPETGNGFKELAAYDEDRNNWIDENDSIYSKLSLWSRENGKDVLTGLKAANVGAIYLGNASTSFDMKNADNELLAQVRKTGVYLKENGGAGTVQQIDLSA